MSNLAYILSICDDIIIRVHPDVSADIINTVTSEHPYRSKDGGFGNPLAKAMRQRDYILTRGYWGDKSKGPTKPIKKFEVVVIDAKEEMADLIFKKYSNGKILANPDMSESERYLKACSWIAHQPLLVKYDQRAFMHVVANDVKEYMTGTEFHDLLHRLREDYKSNQLFDFNEKQKIMEILNKMPSELSTKMKFKIALGVDWRCFPTPSSTVIPTIEDSKELCEVAFFWWDLLKGTFLENFAMSKKAILYLELGQDDKYIETYRQMLKQPNLPEYILQTAISNINCIQNSYKSLFDEANKALMATRAKVALDKIQEWFKKSSGLGRLKLERDAIRIKETAYQILRQEGKF